MTSHNFIEFKAVGKHMTRQKEPPKVFYKKGVLKNAAEFSRK